MKKIFLLIINTFLAITATLQATDSYDPFHVSKEDVAAVLNKTYITPVTRIKSLPADISYICVDAKYKDGALKVCEGGDSIYMSFRTADVDLNDHVQEVVSPYWGIFWNYLKSFGLPIWHVEAKGAPNALALEVLSRLGGHYAANLHFLESDPLFKKLVAQKQKTTNAISSHKGIIVYRARNEAERNGATITNFRKKYPQFLYVNEYARDHFKRKDNTYKLFAHANMNEFVPQSKVYPTTYTPALSKQIVKDFPGVDVFVIKPTFSSLSNGVNAIHKNDLDAFLKKILADRNNIPANSHRCFNFWKHTKQPTFVVTEYVPSKTIYKDGNPYDPTMRIVFMMHHDAGKIGITPITGFWKIPVKSLNDNVSLTDKHITIAHAGAYYSGILVDKKDWQEIEAILCENLPQLYKAMLEQEVAP